MARHRHLHSPRVRDDVIAAPNGYASVFVPVEWLWSALCRDWLPYAFAAFLRSPFAVCGGQQSTPWPRPVTTPMCGTSFFSSSTFFPSAVSSQPVCNFSSHGGLTSPLLSSPPHLSSPLLPSPASHPLYSDVVKRSVARSQPVRARTVAKSLTSAPSHPKPAPALRPSLRGAPASPSLSTITSSVASSSTSSSSASSSSLSSAVRAVSTVSASSASSSSQLSRLASSSASFSSPPASSASSASSSASSSSNSFSSASSSSSGCHSSSSSVSLSSYSDIDSAVAPCQSFCGIVLPREFGLKKRHIRIRRPMHVCASVPPTGRPSLKRSASDAGAWVDPYEHSDRRADDLVDQCVLDADDESSQCTDCGSEEWPAAFGPFVCGVVAPVKRQVPRRSPGRH